MKTLPMISFPVVIDDDAIMQADVAVAAVAEEVKNDPVLLELMTHVCPDETDPCIGGQVKESIEHVITVAICAALNRPYTRKQRPS